MAIVTIRLLAIFSLTWLLASCGGGGQAPPVVNPPDPPVENPANPTPQGSWLSTVYDLLPLPGEAFSPYVVGGEQTTAQEILTLTNVERAAEGLVPLTGDAHLNRVAQAHAVDMATNGFFNHQNQFDMAPWDRLDAVNPPAYVKAGENIAAGQPTGQAVMTSWMDSQGHRENILDSGYTYMGVGVYNDPGSPMGVYYVQMFATFPSDPTLHGWYEPSP